MDQETIGLIGPGRMGLAMVRHLAAAGYAVTATDVNRDRLQEAEQAGATAVETTAEVGRACTYAIVAVGFEPETLEVTTGAGGLVETMKEGGCIAICSTASPETVQGIAEQAAHRGTRPR